MTAVRAITVALVFALTACASAGTQVDQSKVAAFERGKTTYADVVMALDSPNANIVNADGSRVIVYTYAQARTRPESFIPLVGPLVGGADAKSDTYSFTFDLSGILRGTSTGSTQASSNTGLLGH